MAYDQLEIRIHELEKVMKKEKNRRLYERYQAIMLHLKGYTNIKIAEIVGHSNLTIGTDIKRYQAGGIGTQIGNELDSTFTSRVDISRIEHYIQR